MLIIRKAFQFGDLNEEIELPSGIKLSSCTHEDGSFGISGIIKGESTKYVYIVAIPDWEHQEIIIATCKESPHKRETFSIAAFIVDEFGRTPEEHLRDIIVDFLAKLCITREKLSW